MYLNPIQHDEYAAQEAARKDSSKWGSVNAALSQIGSTFGIQSDNISRVEARVAKLEASVVPFVEWMRSIYPEETALRVHEFRTSTAVINRMEQAADVEMSERAA